jgi:hypothetical protein
VETCEEETELEVVETEDDVELTLEDTEDDVLESELAIELEEVDVELAVEELILRAELEESEERLDELEELRLEEMLETEREDIELDVEMVVVVMLDALEETLVVEIEEALAALEVVLCRSRSLIRFKSVVTGLSAGAEEELEERRRRVRRLSPWASAGSMREARRSRMEVSCGSSSSTKAAGSITLSLGMWSTEVRALMASARVMGALPSRA